MKRGLISYTGGRLRLTSTDQTNAKSDAKHQANAYSMHRPACDCCNAGRRFGWNWNYLCQTDINDGMHTQFCHWAPSIGKITSCRPTHKLRNGVSPKVHQPIADSLCARSCAPVKCFNTKIIVRCTVFPSKTFTLRHHWRGVYHSFRRNVRCCEQFPGESLCFFVNVSCFRRFLNELYLGQQHAYPYTHISAISWCYALFVFFLSFLFSFLQPFVLGVVRSSNEYSIDKSNARTQSHFAWQERKYIVHDRDIAAMARLIRSYIQFRFMVLCSLTSVETWNVEREKICFELRINHISHATSTSTTTTRINSNVNF